MHEGEGNDSGTPRPRRLTARHRRVARVLAGAAFLQIATFPSMIRAQQDDEALRRAAQNPIASLISLPLQNNTDFQLLPGDRVLNILNVQPVYPVNLGRVNLINRLIAPILSAPIGADDRKSGLGDLVYTAFFSPAEPSKVTWGVGPVFLVPTATDDALGTGKWGIGPSAVVFASVGLVAFGGLVNNIWSYAGDDSRGDVNLFLIQPFAYYNLRDGWYFLSAPILTANWEAESGSRWTIPLGGGVGRLFAIGKQKVNANVQGYGYVEHPADATVLLRAQLQFLFPKKG